MEEDSGLYSYTARSKCGWAKPNVNMVCYVNKGEVVKLCGRIKINDCLMSGSQKTTKHSVVKNRQPNRSSAW